MVAHLACAGFRTRLALYSRATRTMMKRQRATNNGHGTRVQLPPFDRLSGDLLRNIASMLTTRDWLRLVQSIPADQRAPWQSLAVEQAFVEADAELFHLDHAHMLYDLARGAQPTLKRLQLESWALPPLGLWNVWINSPQLRKLVWKYTNSDGLNEHVETRVAALAIRNWQCLHLDLSHVSFSSDKHMALLTRALKMNQVQPQLTELMLQFGRSDSVMTQAFSRQMLGAFPQLQKLHLATRWTPSLLSDIRTALPKLRDLSLWRETSCEWPPLETLASFMDALRMFRLRQGHLSMRYTGAVGDKAPAFEMESSYSTTPDEHGRELPIEVLVPLLTRVSLRWSTVTIVNNDRDAIRKLAAREDWRVEGTVTLCRYTDRPWTFENHGDYDDALVRAVASGRWQSLSLIDSGDDDEEEEESSEDKQLVLYDKALSSLHLDSSTLVPWLRALKPTSVDFDMEEWSVNQDALTALVAASVSTNLRGFQLDAHQCVAQKGSSVIVRHVDILWPADETMPRELEIFAVADYYPLPAKTIRSFADMTHLRQLQFATKEPLGHDDALQFPRTLTTLSIVSRASTEIKQPMDANTLMRAAERYVDIEELVLDMRPSKLTNQAPAFWQTFGRMLPRLSMLTLAYHSSGLVVDEWTALRSVLPTVDLTVRLSSFAPCSADRARYRMPDVDDDKVNLNGLSLASNEDDVAKSPTLTNLFMSPSREEERIVWPRHLTIVGDDVEREEDDSTTFERYVHWLSEQPGLDFSYPTQLNTRFSVVFAPKARMLVDGQHVETLGPFDSLDDAVKNFPEAKVYAIHLVWPPQWPGGDEEMFLLHPGHFGGLALQSLYLTLRLLNPAMPGSRIAQALFRPNWDAKLPKMDEFARFCCARERVPW